MSKVHYIHRRRVENGKIHNNGGVTIAFREVPEVGIEFAIARCSPKDNFSRYLGRVKAEGRLNSPSKVSVTELGYDEFIQSICQLYEYI